MRRRANEWPAALSLILFVLAMVLVPSLDAPDLQCGTDAECAALWGGSGGPEPAAEVR